MGLGMPHGSKRTEIDGLLALPVPYAAKQRLLIASAMAGEVLPSEILVAGDRRAARESRQDRSLGDWRKTVASLMNWVELFAFSGSARSRARRA